MAIFKVGQRVRIIATEQDYLYLLGCEATIYAIPYYEADCGVIVDGYPESKNYPAWCTSFDGIAPLTDPSADAFIASIKAMKPYEEPKVGKKEGVVT